MAVQYLTILTNNDYRQKFGYDKPNMSVRAAAINCGASFLNLPGTIEGAPKAYFTDTVLENKMDMLLTENISHQPYHLYSSQPLIKILFVIVLSD